jgi:hypothetical protein
VVGNEQIERRTSNVQFRTSNMDGAALYLNFKPINRTILKRRSLCSVFF